MKNLETIYIPSVDMLPDETSSERQLLKLQGVQSIVCVPMLYGNSLVGFLGFDSVREEKVWEKEDITLLKIAGGIFANALERKRTANLIREGNHFLENIFASIQDGLSILDNELNVVRVNPGIEKWYAYSMPIVGKKCYEAYHRRDKPCDICPTIRAISTKKMAYDVIPKRGSDGNIEGWLDLYSFPLIDTETGQMKGVIEYVRDISERKKAEEEAKNLAKFPLEDPHPVLRISREGIILFANPASKPLMEEWNRKIGEEAPVFLQELVAEALRVGEIKGHVEISYKNRVFSFTIVPIVTHGYVNLYGADITSRKQAENKIAVINKKLLKSNKKLRQISLRDSQTGLYNHRYLEEIIEPEFYRAKRYGHSLSAIMLDIDYFKSINDVYGHLFGDTVLKQLAKQLKRIVRQYDVVIRFGGEEFVIVSPGTDRPTVLVLAQRLLDAINLYNFGNKKYIVKLKLSMAVASYPEDRINTGMDLIELTNQILNKVKEFGGNKVYSSIDISRQRSPLEEKSAGDANIKSMKEKIEDLTKRANQSLIEAVFAFAKTIELKDRYTGQHTERTVKYATNIAKMLDLPKDEIERIRQASILHDLGKIGISEKILLKRSKLSKGEFGELKKHPHIGVDIIRPIHFLHDIMPLILYHHERWDGKGYPNALRGEEIPIGARIVAIADVFQALTSKRPYRKAYSKKEAINIIKNGTGTQFDPKVVQAFLKILRNSKPR
ncbi:MAG: diguanylate cyclase [Candidatus Omnitrophica bacterium]|nr:diguanylate cyclase [Candidatus Omnitrophota bacterium]